MQFDATFFALVALIIFLAIAAYAGAFKKLGAGLDTRDARVQRALAALDVRALAALPRRTAGATSAATSAPPQTTAARRLLAAFAAASAPGRTLTPQRLLYALLALRLAAQVYRLLLSRAAAAPDALHEL